MITDEFKTEVNSLIKHQADALLAKQASIFASNYRSRTGSVAAALQSEIRVMDGEVSIPYPIHIRFLDMKRYRTSRGMKRKKRYAAIYNKYVFGYMKSGIWRGLNAMVPKVMIKTITENITTVK